MPKISQLPSVQAVNDADNFIIEQGGETKRAATTALTDALNAQISQSLTDSINAVTQMQSDVNASISDIDAAIANVVNSFNHTDLAQAVQAASGGNMRVIYDDVGLPSFMYRVTKQNIEDIGLPGAGVHKAFIVNGVEVPEFWYGAYQATIINGRAYCLPGVEPTTSINFDAAFNACTAKGAGWHLASNAEWSAIQGICRSMGHIPRGNTNYGRAYDAVFETGRRVDNLAPGTASGTGCTYTGSGPASWNHNGQEFGISDLVGNTWEWQTGLRLVDGEIQIIPDNDAANQADNSETSTEWRAILQDGSLVTPGTADTLKIDGTSATNAQSAKINSALTNVIGDSNYTYTVFETLNSEAGVTIPDILKEIGIAPYTTHDSDVMWARNAGERLPFRGGAWYYVAIAGLSSLNLDSFRSSTSNSLVGFRPAFCEL